MPFEIVKFPAKVLQRPARRVVETDVAELGNIVSQMKEVMKEGRGIGLAAPQVGLGIRLFIAHDSKAGQTRAFVNPQITEASTESEVASEGCLSFPDLYADVERHLEITLQFQDLDLTAHEEVVTGWFARIVQHEIDHLNGILLPDRAIDGMYEAEDTEELSEEERSSDPIEITVGPSDVDGGR